MAELETPGVPTGGPYFPTPAQGAQQPGVNQRDELAQKLFVRLLGDAFALNIDKEVEISAKDFAAQSFVAADAWLATRAVM